MQIDIEMRICRFLFNARNEIHKVFDFYLESSSAPTIDTMYYLLYVELIFWQFYRIYTVYRVFHKALFANNRRKSVYVSSLTQAFGKFFWSRCMHEWSAFGWMIESKLVHALSFFHAIYIQASIGLSHFLWAIQFSCAVCNLFASIWFVFCTNERALSQL